MQELILEAGRTERHYWRDLWRYRELFYFLAWRDLIVRYKQTVVGVAWSLVRPLLSVIVLTVVFGYVSGMDSGGVPYSLVVFCGMLPWQFFSTALTESGNSLVANSNLISKIYFPRLIVPGSSIVTSFVDFLVAASFLFVLMVWYRFVPSAHIVFLPLFVLLAIAASLSVGIWVAALMVEYRDFRVIVPFVVQFGMYATPVGYLSSYITHRLSTHVSHWSSGRSGHWLGGHSVEQIEPVVRMLYSLNPVVGVIDGFRWCLLGGENDLYLPGLMISMGVVAGLLVTGVWYFRKMERSFADVI